MRLTRTITIPAAGLLTLCLAMLGGAAGGMGQEKPPAPKQAQPERIAALIRQLGDVKFQKREAAARELEILGEAALPALRRAAAKASDVEPRQRAARLIDSIQTRLDRSDFPGTPAPKDAVVLFDGKRLDGWMQRNSQEPTWKVKDGGILEVSGGTKFPGLDILTRQTFVGGYRLHAEFQVPPGGNSGIYLQGLYEVQIFDSHGKPPDFWSCGSIYGLIDPRVNASKPAGVWQAFDIDFYPAEFAGDRKTRAARVTVVHNGVKIHDFAAVQATGSDGLPTDPSGPGNISKTLGVFAQARWRRARRPSGVFTILCW